MKKKYRKIKTLYEEALFCDTCDVQLEQTISNTMAQAGVLQIVYQCPKCGAVTPITRPQDLPAGSFAESDEWIEYEEGQTWRDLAGDKEEEIEEEKIPEKVTASGIILS